ncbi:glycoside hydrolase family 5 protein [Aurantiacibacter sp. MUD61]|uniref:glycoside hydrolase family 5 protein n=1 Tax=Aurantiacibacter sp. MUD61 TaxID=3009083 RepID=UPI0022F055BD|nr:glycoside hydrolase family 5 protein [Aurantiacibacter sp. MUD61]
MSTLTLLATALLAAAADNSAAHDIPDPLPVGQCINVGNHLEPEQESSWGGEILDAEDFASIRGAGFDTIRLPVRWANKTGPGPDYVVDAVWMDRVQEVVDMAFAADLNVLLDSHNFEELHANPAANTAKLAAIWRQIGARFADYPDERLWFEIENEPHDALTNRNLLDTLTPALLAIRETNSSRPVVIGGEWWSGVDSLATLELPDDPNVHPTFHYYEPFDFTHQGASWVDPSPTIGRTYGTEADRQRLANDALKVVAYMARTGRTPFIGETGAYDAHISLEQRVAYHSAVTQQFAPLGIDSCMWAYTNTFPFRDQETGEWHPELLEAIQWSSGAE